MLTVEKEFLHSKFMGIPNPSTFKHHYTFGDDGSVKIEDDWENALTFKPIDLGVKYEVTIEKVNEVVKQTFKWKNFYVEIKWDFSFEDRVKTTLTGELPRKMWIKFPFEVKLNENYKLIVQKEQKRFFACLIDPVKPNVPDIGIGFDWKDVKLPCELDEKGKIFKIETPKSFKIDPSIIATTTASDAVYFPYQHKIFHAQDLFWAFYTDGSSLLYRTSSDGMVWSDPTFIWSADRGRHFSVYLRNDYVHLVVCGEGWGEFVKYRRGKLNPDGTITWDYWQYYAIGHYAYGTRHTRILHPRLVTGEIYSLELPARYTLINYDTTVKPTQTGLYLIYPYKTVTTPNLIEKPVDITFVGWESAELGEPNNNQWWMDGRVEIKLRFKTTNTVTIPSWGGKIWMKLWKADNPDLSGRTPLMYWGSADISFDGSPEQVKDYTFPIYLISPLREKYIFLELIWEQTTTPPEGAGFGIEGGYGYSYVRIAPQIFYFPTICVDELGYPLIAYMRYDGFGWYPQVSRGNANDGTWNIKLAKHWKLSGTSRLLGWRVGVTALKENKAYVLYNAGVGLTYGRLITGETIGDEEDIYTLIGVKPYTHMSFDISSKNNDVLLVYVESGTYDIKFTKRIYEVGWVSPIILQAATTAYSIPVISSDLLTGDMWAFWMGAPTPNHIFYRRYNKALDVWEDVVDWIDESAEVLTDNDRLTCFEHQYGNYIGLMYQTKTASPYNIKFDKLIVVIPVIRRVFIDGFVSITT